ncbi:sensor histidine kinase [Nitrogeniibacter aestuarii]|uniref:sensor histidine kinase n=1 Tax=Nitrogeniibacter aestuarii TaxID=2815343 RepID=UPI001E32B940|nr:HAMP domain-containing sensor histidine kinase [Nitrogeniibacter aestuarii]
MAGFLLIAVVLGAAAVQGLRLLETFADQSRKGADMAIGLTSSAQKLSERTIDMERSARQYRVLGEPALRARFLDQRIAAEGALRVFATAAPATLGGVADTWRAAAQQAERALDDDDGDAELRESLNRLHALNDRLATEARYWVSRQNTGLLDALEANRVRLATEVMGAVAAAVVIAGLFGWWLSRPVKQIERGIEQLGESRFEDRIEVSGPEDLQEVGMRLDWLRQRLIELEADRVRMLRHVSHELKTPLAALREGVSLLDDEVAGPLTSGQRELVGILGDNAHVLQGRIEDLLGFNAAVFDARRLRRESIDLNELMSRLADGQRLQAQARDVTINLDVARVTINGDREKLAVAVGNLLSNAVSFSPAHGTVTLRASRTGDTVFVECIDEGPGVAAEDATRIFDPFFQGRRQPDSERRGSGVGLSIVREYIQAHGGHVALIAAEKGAHFRIELPNLN